ncbi:5-3 exoribonuclease 1 [Gigaspora margarita]|uniref:5-3 exoribonuclease 1 n=1 Tax=Gigaspora margarita TaxID=4874 RepID=A0A8H4A6W4_GIGMA|nr:5-3 exoribonuclease 1 [Gigaspora margarita]
MGIQGFERWIKDRYSKNNKFVEHIKKGFIKENPDNFYIDMNGIIHGIINENLKTYNNDIIFNAICGYIDDLIFMIDPNKLIFIAIDGVAPRAKMNEQRKRRFKNANANNKFDRNSVTPGTKFMKDLSEYIKEFISNKIQNDDDWGTKKIIYSGHDVPGEGEYKILEYIRRSELDSLKHLIFGKDSDIILLGLLQYKKNIKVICTEQITSKTKEFEIKALPILREDLKEEFKKLWDTNSRPPFEFDIGSIIKDFVLLTFFVGNDFITGFQKFYIKYKGLDLSIHIYKEVLKDCDGYINDEGKLNLKTLEKIFAKLCIIEKYENNENYLELYKKIQKNSTEATKKNEAEFQKWKSNYYRDHHRESLIQSYIKGLQWIISYYNGTLKSCRWFYPGHRSPMISDLQNLNMSEINFDVEDYYKPFEHLMFVLPPISKDLLPKAFQNLMNDFRIEKFYPETTKKNYILPFIDDELLLSVLECEY